MNQVDFAKLVGLAMKIPGRNKLRPVIEKELLHYDILFALEEAGLLDSLTFQGGTALRLCYGAQRFSEDLDFSGGTNFSTSSMLKIKKCIENHIGSRYGLEVHVKEPKDLNLETDALGIKVDRWQISVVTAPKKKDLPKQKIRIEIANIPAYTRSPRQLILNYDFLPDGYNDLLVMTESLDEILADKVIAYVNCKAYVRYRDLWDFRWLLQKEAKLNIDFVNSKIKDYRIEGYSEKLDHAIENLSTTIHSKNFIDQMSRFIPIDIQEATLLKDKFKLFLQDQVGNLLKQTKIELGA